MERSRCRRCNRTQASPRADVKDRSRQRRSSRDGANRRAVYPAHFRRMRGEDEPGENAPHCVGRAATRAAAATAPRLQLRHSLREPMPQTANVAVFTRSLRRGPSSRASATSTTDLEYFGCSCAEALRLTAPCYSSATIQPPWAEASGSSGTTEGGFGFSARNRRFSEATRSSGKRAPSSMAAADLSLLANRRRERCSAARHERFLHRRPSTT